MFGKRSGGAVVRADSGCGCIPASVVSSVPFPALRPRDELKRHYNLGEYWIEVEMEDLASFDEDLADYLYKQPAEHLQLVSEALSLNPQGWPPSHHSQPVPFLRSSWRKLPRRWLMR